VTAALTFRGVFLLNYRFHRATKVLVELHAVSRPPPKEDARMKSMAGLGAAALLFSLAQPVAIGAEPATLDRYVELLRTDLKADKTAILTEALALTDAEGKAFWPIYREYDTELSLLGDQRYSLLKQYAKAYNADVVSDDLAADLARNFMDLQKRRLTLMEKYYKKFAKDVSPMRAAQFLQAENQIGLLVDLAIASEVPFLEKGKAVASDK
jgi:hypothetical protein